LLKESEICINIGLCKNILKEKRGKRGKEKEREKRKGKKKER
jgi:hypothetical protein